MRGLDFCVRREAVTQQRAESEREQVPGVTQCAVLAGCLCVFGKQTLPKIERGGVNEKDIVFFFFPQKHDFVCMHKFCKVSQGRVIPLESQEGGCEPGEYPV